MATINVMRLWHVMPLNLTAQLRCKQRQTTKTGLKYCYPVSLQDLDGQHHIRVSTKKYQKRVLRKVPLLSLSENKRRPMN